MYSAAARYYDVLHDARRDADVEAALVIAEIRRRQPNAESLLDAGCGTGAHLPAFARDFEVVGLDASPQMLELAAARCPGTPLRTGDFRTFRLEQTFDAVVCLFSGIGYLVQLDDLEAGLANLAHHVAPGGVLLVEGWVEPEFWLGDSVAAGSGRQGDLAVARAVRSVRDGRRCEIEMSYAAATPSGIDIVHERHVLRLSDPGEFEAAFAGAGLTFERLPHMLHQGRAVYVGARRA